MAGHLLHILYSTLTLTQTILFTTASFIGAIKNKIDPDKKSADSFYHEYTAHTNCMYTKDTILPRPIFVDVALKKVFTE